MAICGSRVFYLNRFCINMLSLFYLPKSTFCVCFKCDLLEFLYDVKYNPIARTTNKLVNKVFVFSFEPLSIACFHFVAQHYFITVKSRCTSSFFVCKFNEIKIDVEVYMYILKSTHINTYARARNRLLACIVRVRVHTEPYRIPSSGLQLDE